MQQGRTTQYSTAGLRGVACARAWQNYILDVFYPLESYPEQPDKFRGHLEALQLPEVALSRYAADALRSRRFARAARQEEFILFIPVAQRQWFCQHGLEREAGPGELVVFNVARDYTTRLGDRSRCLTMRVDADLLRAHVPGIDDFHMRDLQPNPRLLSIVANMVAETMDAGRRTVRDGDPAPLPARTGHALLDLISLTFLMHPDDRDAEASNPSLAAVHYRNLIRHIRGHFRAPDLTPDSAAAAARISTRYLHKLFRMHGSTFGETVLSLRLEQATRLLRQPLSANARMLQVAEIAYACGFSSQSHFSTSYRRQFGHTPTEARR